MSGWELVGAILLAWVAISVLMGLFFGALSRTGGGNHTRSRARFVNEPRAANDR